MCLIQLSYLESPWLIQILKLHKMETQKKKENTFVYLLNSAFIYITLHSYKTNSIQAFLFSSYKKRKD